MSPKKASGDRPASKHPEHVELTVVVKGTSTKAIHVDTLNSKGMIVSLWIPRSKVVYTDCIAEGDNGIVWLTPKFAAYLKLVEE